MCRVHPSFSTTPLASIFRTDYKLRIWIHIGCTEDSDPGSASAPLRSESKCGSGGKSRLKSTKISYKGYAFSMRILIQEGLP